jgi:hypothetical protein
MKVLLIGMGEIGKAICEVFYKYHGIKLYDTNGEYDQPEGKFDILLVCIPWQENFVDIVNGYINLHKIKATIVFSTVPIGTTSKIQDAVHAPVEGRHPNLVESIKKWQFFMGGWNEMAYRFFKDSVKAPVVLDLPEHTEALKLMSTSFYGLMIEYTRYMNEVCKNLGMNFIDVRSYNYAYNVLYNGLGEQRFIRSLLTPPEGNIGGHCVVPNAKLLDAQYPSVFLKEIYKEKE